MTQNKDLTGKNVFVTGAASGIGFHLAAGFAQAGARVILSDRDGAGAQDHATDLTRQGYTVKGLRCDVTIENEVESAIVQVIDAFGSVDILVNNAGLQHVALLEDFPVEKFEHMIRVMLTGPFMLTKAVIPMMKKQQFGRIINISSINGLVGFAGKSAYNSAKHGLIGLTKVTALEGADYGITANAICPGYVDTPLVRGQFEDLARTRHTTADRVLKEVIFPLVPQKRLIHTDEIVQAALFLCAESSAGITGQSLIIDGGYTIQ